MKRARNCSASSTMPNAITASGIHSRVPDEIEVCPRSNARPGEAHHRDGEEADEQRRDQRGGDLHQAARSRREPAEHQRDADVAAGAQRHGGAEGEARRHQVGGILPRHRNVGRHPGDEVRQRPHGDLGEHQQGERDQAGGADPAVEPSEPVDRVEQQPQRRGRRCVGAVCWVHAQLSHPSCPGLTRASTTCFRITRKAWMAGTQAAAMTKSTTSSASLPPETPSRASRRPARA